MNTAKRNKLLLSLSVVFFWFAQYVYVPFQTPYLNGLGIAAASVGVILGAYGFSQTIVRIPVGVLADKRNRHKIFIAAGVLGAGAASLLRYLSPTAGAFLAANLISGLASSMWISFTLLYTSFFDPAESKKALGRITALNNLGILLGFVLGYVVAETVNVETLFLMSLGAGVIGFVISLFLKEEKSAPREIPVRELLSALKNRRLWAFAIIAMLMQAISLSTLLSFTSDAAEALGGTNFEIGLCSSIGIVFSVLSSAFVGTRAAARLGDRRLITGCFALLAIYCALVPLAESMVALYFLQMLGGTGTAAIFAVAMSNAIAEIPPEKRSTAMGFHQAIYGLGMTLGPALMGAVTEGASLMWGFFALAAIALVGLIFTQVVWKRLK